MSGFPGVPTASVVVPTYNRSDLLQRTLVSLAAQTLPVNDFEVIVADCWWSASARASTPVGQSWRQAGRPVRA